MSDYATERDVAALADCYTAAPRYRKQHMLKAIATARAEGYREALEAAESVGCDCDHDWLCGRCAAVAAIRALAKEGER